MTKLPFPEAALDQHIVALGKTGAGKSSAVRDIVEYLLDADKRVIVATAKADWWGIKLAADGKHAGYPLPIFGGDHQDLPLHHLSGKTMAELLGTGNRSAVLQMRDMMPGERTQFWIDFTSTLFRILKGKIYLVIDEVHNFAPKGKTLDPKAGMMLHWSNKLAAEARGIGITLIGASQRPAKVHNDFLTSCETLIAMRVTTKWDRDAMKDWIEGCGDPEKGKEVLNSLAQMKRGDAWVWSPEIEFGPKQIHFPMFKTYDSFRPQSLEDADKLKGWADVDLADVRKRLEHVVKEVEANDPAKLKTRIRDLELRLAGKVVTEVAVSTSQEYRRIEADLADAKKVVAMLNQYASDCEDFIATQATAMGNAMGTLEDMVKRQPPDPKLRKINKKVLDKYVPPGTTFINPKLYHSTAGPSPVFTEINGNLKGPEKRVLKALGELLSIGKNHPPKNMVGGWSGYSPTSGGFANILSNLKTKGLIEYPNPGTIALTNAGAAAVGHCATPSRDELFRRFESLCSGPQRKILEGLLAREEGMTKEQIANATGYSVTSGGFANLLSELRTKGLVEYPSPGMVKAPSWIFEL